MKHIDSRELVSLPNILSYIRIILIPVFIIIYLNADNSAEYYASAAVILASWFTDMLDGFIARRFSMVTDFGKFLDPLADKLTQGAMVLCLVSRYPLMWLAVCLLLIKEAFMATAGIVILKKYGRKLNGARWFGKMCTGVIYISILILLVYPSIPLGAANALISVCSAVMLFTLIMYIPEFVKLTKPAQDGSRLDESRSDSGL